MIPKQPVEPVNLTPTTTPTRTEIANAILQLLAEYQREIDDKIEQRNQFLRELANANDANAYNRILEEIKTERRLNDDVDECKNRNPKRANNEQ